MALLLGWNTLTGGSDLHIPLQGPLSTDLAVLILIPRLFSVSASSDDDWPIDFRSVEPT